MRGWSPDVGPRLDSAIDQLRTAELTVAGRLPWSSNLTFLVTLEDGGPEPLNAVYKPARGEQSLWDFPGGLYRREVAAFALSEGLGWGLVPPTVERDDGPFGPGSLQLFVEADYGQHYFTLFDQGGHDAVLRTTCAFDVVANNADRKSGHVLLGPDGRLWAIDHGLCFHHQPKLRTVIWDFADEPVPGDLLADLDGLASSLPEDLDRVLSAAEREALVARIRHLVDSGVFPGPIGDRPPYPWPLV
ncbi:MAG TPA: SCO1664 family protein [Acidimicrobiales bacterium]|nr:SCO1664 family protein [Acidimicrobiales bacterium]